MMDATEYCMALRHLKLTGPQCAALFGYSRQTHYQHWQHIGPPLPVAMFLRLMIRTGMSQKQVMTYTKS
jgi:hypothetical protein